MRNENKKSGGTYSLILESAERQFARFGYSRVTMEDIAAEAGFRKASLYYYFPTKEELFQAVLDRKYEEFRRQVELLLSNGASARERVQAYVEARYEFFSHLLHLNTLDYRTTTRNKPAFRAIFRKYADQELKWLTGIFESGLAHGEFALESPRRSAEVFLHVMQGLRARFMRDHEDIPASSAAFAQFRKEALFVTEIFLNGISGRKAKKTDRAKT